MLLNHLRDSLKGPVNLLTADDERGRDANHSVVRLLAQDSFFLERFAVGTREAVKFDADPQAFAAYLFQVRAAQRLQQGQEVSAQLGGTFHHFLLDEDAQRGPRDSTAHGVAAEGAAMVAGFVHPKNFSRRQYGRDWIEPAGQCLAYDQ